MREKTNEKRPGNRGYPARNRLATATSRLTLPLEQLSEGSTDLRHFAAKLVYLAAQLLDRPVRTFRTRAFRRHIRTGNVRPRARHGLHHPLDLSGEHLGLVGHPGRVKVLHRNSQVVNSPLQLRVPDRRASRLRRPVHLAPAHRLHQLPAPALQHLGLFVPAGFAQAVDLPFQLLQLPQFRRLGLIGTRLIRTGLIRTGLIRTGLIRTGLIRTGLIRTGLIRTGLIRTGLIRTGLIRTGAFPPGGRDDFTHPALDPLQLAGQFTDRRVNFSVFSQDRFQLASNLTGPLF